MSADAVIMMVVVLGAVWGGFAVLLRIAMQKEKDKKQE